MSLGEELRRADPKRMDSLVDDLLTTTPTPTDAQTLEHFTDTEMELALNAYPILRVIHDRIDEAFIYMHEIGASNERLGGILTGMELVIMCVAAYADLDIPDSPE